MTSWIVSLASRQSFRVGAFLASERIRPMISMDRIFKRPFLWPELYRSPGRVSIPVLLDEKSAVVPVRLAGEQSGGKRKVSYGDARWNSERAAPSACVGRRFSASQIVWNRSTRHAGARVGRPR